MSIISSFIQKMQILPDIALFEKQKPYYKVICVHQHTQTIHNYFTAIAGKSSGYDKDVNLYILEKDREKGKENEEPEFVFAKSDKSVLVGTIL